MCNNGCPLGINIPTFIRYLREGDAASALAIIHQQNPFPAICGRVCPAPCEVACIFHADGHPIAIRDLERYAADNGNIRTVKKPLPARLGKKIAILGSGPAGLMAAIQLANLGYSITMYEAAPQPGGILRYGIPEFRLPQKVLDDVMAQVRQSGVEIICNAVFGRTITLQELMMRGFQSIVIAFGASQPVFDNFPQAHLAGVYHHIEFVQRIHQYSKSLVFEAGQKMLLGRSTVVLTNHIAAFDSARLARRLGQEVTVCWTGSEEALSERRDILTQAQEEGITVKEGIELMTVESNEHGQVTGIIVRDLIENTEELITATTLIWGGDSQPNDFVRQHLPQMRFNDDSTLWINPATGMTSIDKVFACGNMVIGPQSIVHAMAHAKDIAAKIHLHLEKS